MPFLGAVYFNKEKEDEIFRPLFASFKKYTKIKTYLSIRGFSNSRSSFVLEKYLVYFSSLNPNLVHRRIINLK